MALCLCHLGEMVGAVVQGRPTVGHSGAGLVGWQELACLEARVLLSWAVSCGAQTLLQILLSR